MPKKLILVVVLIIAIVAAFYFDVFQYLSLEAFKGSRADLEAWQGNNPWQFAALFFVIYVAVTALSLPGAAILTLAAGALFGLLQGTVMASFASSIGATLAFLISRSLFYDVVEEKFGKSLQNIKQGVERDGNFYLFSMRLVPAFPFFVINLVMALTPMKAWPFYWVSQLGMLAGTLVYVNAGTQLADLESTSDIVSLPLIGSFLLLALFPWIVKAVMAQVEKRRGSNVV